MIARTCNPDFLNTVVNHDEVRPWLGGEGVLNIAPQALDPNNYVLTCDQGGFILMRHEPGIYEVHSQFLPGNRAAPIRAMREAMEYMFTRTDCETLVSQVPDDNKAAAGIAMAGGLREIFHRDDGPRGPASYVQLGIMDWAMRTKSLEQPGAWFHAELETAKAKHASELETHEHDEAHERAVGASVLMMKAGNAAKGVRFYNRWARMAGYAPITLVSETPIVVDVVDAVVGVRGQDLEILLCR
jgi:hypothetical protein